MKRSTDLLLNLVAPLLAGLALYFIKGSVYLPTIIKNHLADALWAYAFLSAMLILWGRVIHLPWIVAVFITAALFEGAQYVGWVNGTADIADLAAYFFAFALALIVNLFIKHSYLPKQTKHAFP